MALCAAGIFNTLFVSVMERLREFGILLAIGMSSKRLFSLVMWESFWLGLVGLFTAAVLTAWPYHYLNTTGIDLTQATGGKDNIEVAGVAISLVMKAEIEPMSLILVGLAALCATLLAGLYPAWKAGRVDPVQSIKAV